MKIDYIPNIRFSGYTDEWNKRRFSDLVNRVSEQSNDDSLPKVEFEDIVSGEGRLNKDISKKFDERKGIVFEPNFILYGKLRPYLKNWLLPNFKGIALGDFWVFKSIDSPSTFIYYLIQTDRYQIAANLSSGTKMPRSDWKTVSETQFRVPSTEEQKKIGNFFKQLDETIILQQQELENLKQTKQGFLQKMFPKEGESVPEIRFPDFVRNWEESSLKEIANYRNGKAHERDISEDGNYVVINSKFISTNGKVKKYSDRQIEPMKKNEIAFVLSDVPNGRAIAKTFLVDENNKYSLNQRIAGITPCSDTNAYFLYILLNRHNYFLKFDTGVGQTNLSKTEIESFTEKYPVIEEQTKIGNLFKQLDETITLHQQELDALQETKKGFLQKMFV